MAEKTGTAEHTAAVAARLVAEQESRIKNQRRLIEGIERDGQVGAARDARLLLQQMTTLLMQLQISLAEAWQRASLEPLEGPVIDKVSRDRAR